MTIAPSSPGRASVPSGLEKLYEQVLDVEVHALMLFALAGNQGNFLATVAVVDLAAERLLNHLPFVRQQHHGRRNDPAWTKIPNVLGRVRSGPA